jgi:hypothetical protein
VEPAGAEPGRAGQGTALEVCLDARDPARQGSGAIEDGVFRVVLVPGARDAHASARTVTGDGVPAAVASRRTRTGYRIEARIERHALLRSAPPDLDRLGFDLAVDACAAGGTRDLRLRWYGRGETADYPSAYGVLLLERSESGP